MKKIWQNSYEKGVPFEIDPDKYSSLGEVWEEAVAKFKDKPSFHNMGKTLSFKEIDGYSLQFASYLQNNLGLKKGDRIALMMPNVLQYPIALFASLRAGLIVVNVNPLYTARELEHQLKDSGATTIVIFENSAHILDSVRENLSLKNIIVTGIGDMLGFPKAQLVNFVLKYVKKMVPPYKLTGAIKFQELLIYGEKEKFKKPTMNNEDIAFLQYTGGTTGVSKGAILTHRNIISNFQQAKVWIENGIFEGQEIIITPLPLYHIFSLTANCMIFSALGALNVLITNPKDIPGFVKELKKWNFSAITGVNTLFNALLHNKEFQSLDFSHLKVTLGGGMAVQRAVANKWKEVTGKPLIEAYGLTETSPACCINPLNIPDYNGKIGLPIPSTIVVIKDDAGNDVAQGEIGELCVKGPQVMKGYWNRDDETAKVFTKDGYLRTGDIAIMDEEGFFKIVDRKKDMIIVSGFNVFPNEIEDILATNSKVLESAAVGVPDERTGEAVKVFIVKKDKSLTEEEVIKFCRENLTGYKVPKLIEFRTELPKTNVGKILRKDLRG